MKRFDLIVVGELNVDLILSDMPSHPQMGKEILAGKMALVLGSSSAILASNISTLGTRTGFVGKIGDDQFGQFILSCLRSKKIDTEHITCSRESKTGATVILSYREDRAMTTYKGAMDQLTLDDVDLNYLRSAQHLHLSSFYLQTGIRKNCAELFKIAKKEGLTTSLDTNWDPEEKWGTDILDVLPFVDVFLPNQYEAMNISCSDTIESALEKLSQYSRTVVIKLGYEGAVAQRDGKVVKSKAFKVKPVDAVGAGDSFNAGFLFKFLQKADLNRCLEFGNVCGALSVSKAGGTGAFIDKIQIEQDIKRHFGYEVNLQA